MIALVEEVKRLESMEAAERERDPVLHRAIVLELVKLRREIAINNVKTRLDPGDGCELEAEPDVTLDIAQPRPAPSCETVCMTMPWSDSASLRATVRRFKDAGVTNMSASWLVRIALSRLDMDALLAEMTTPVGV